ncbi:MAG: DUF4064 domain-containing protein [Bacteroidetes bacterium]|nr:DUF4064 domain-containing protein [Bacteroidota bacterium]
MEQKPISSAPMILGIIGGVIGLPSAVCSGACAAGISSMASNTTKEEAASTGNTFMWIGLIGAILGFIAAFLYKRKPGTWGLMMLIAGLLSLINLVSLNMMALIPGTLFIIGGAIALSQKNRVAV